jgi:hypothetical protein
MSTERVDVAVRGKTIRVPSATIGDRTVVVTGRLLRIAAVRDEEFVEGVAVRDPPSFMSQMTASGIRADILTFSQRLDERTPRYDYPFEWDNAAVARTSNYTEWWERKLPQETRKNVRRAAKRGVVVSVAAFDDRFIEGIKSIYDEMPVRQGRRFWHFDKAVETVRQENATYLERSEFIGAYFEGELIGFIKFVYVDNAAVLMQILSKSSHYDKRPMNALIAKAVEVCHEKGIAYLVYSKFTFGKKTQSQIAEFKRRNGFEQMDFPRYYVPLTLKGRIALRLKLHRDLLGLLPSAVINVLLAVRSTLLQIMDKASVKRRNAGARPAVERGDAQ